MVEDLKKQVLPIVMATTVISSILYLYASDFIILITILTFLVQNLFFAFFNKVRRSKGNYAVALYSIALIVVFIVARITRFLISIYGGPGCFVQWFFGMQMDKTLVIPYSFIFFIWLNLLISFAIYYFTQVIYRSLVMLLIIIIPIILYAKRYEPISYLYIVFILALYIAVMIYCKHFQRKKTVPLVTDNSCKKSVLIFVLLTLTISMLIPKPTIIPLGGNIGQLLGRARINLASADRYGKFSSDAYGMFSRFSGGSGQLDDQILYKVVATEGLYLRRQTFDFYQGNNWTYDEKYGSRGELGWYRDNDKQNFNKFIEALETIAYHDKKFTEKYNLDELPQLTDSQKTAEVTLNDHRSYIVLCLNNVINILGIDNYLYGTPNNNLFLKGQLNPRDCYTISYFSEAIEINNQSIEFSRKFNKNKYETMLLDVAFSYIKSKSGSSNEIPDIIYKYMVNEKNAYKYYENTYQEPSPRIEDLAKKITEGLYSDYDKAKALEEYFRKNGYVYDLNYQPGKGNEGIEYFIFESKKGSCSNYATAMTLMARAIGLPARYVEGFLMTEKEDATTYVVRTKDAHAFTEVFISGYGWMTFDATVSGTIDQKTAVTQRDTFSRDDIRTIVTCGILVLLLLVIIIITLPFIKEFIFRVRLKYLKNDAAIVLIYTHLKKRFNKKLGIKTYGLTTKMIEDKIYQAYGINITDITIAFEKVYYGGKVLTTAELENSYNTYLNFYNATKRKFLV